MYRQKGKHALKDCNWKVFIKRCALPFLPWLKKISKRFLMGFESLLFIFFSVFSKAYKRHGRVLERLFWNFEFLELSVLFHLRLRSQNSKISSFHWNVPIFVNNGTQEEQNYYDSNNQQQRRCQECISRRLLHPWMMWELPKSRKRGFSH